MPSQAEVIQALQNASNGQGLDPMVPPPQSPADVYAGASPFANALGLPDALKALKGQMTPEEGQAFALTSAMGLLPGAKAESAVAKGAASLAGKGTLTDLGKAAWQAAKANDFQPLARVGLQNLHPQTFADPIDQKLSSVLDEQDWLKAGNSQSKTLADKLAYVWHSGKPIPGASTGSKFDLNTNVLPKMGVNPEDFWAAVSAKSPPMPPISDEAIAKKLASDPGASIFDIAGTNVEGPSSQIKQVGGGSSVSPESMFADIGRTAVPSAPLRASILGRSENLVHGTRESLENWKTPTGDIATGDALRLPDEELGVHFGNPKAAHEFSGSSVNDYDAPRQYPVVVATNNPLRLPDLGSWQAPKVIRALRKQGFPQEELDDLNGISDVRNYLTNKGYDSIVYKNNVEDIGHDSYIKFAPSPEAPKYVAGVRSPFAAFDPSKIMRPELAAGIGGATALSPLGQEYIKALQNGGQQNQ
jgi:hypothetical protein